MCESLNFKVKFILSWRDLPPSTKTRKISLEESMIVLSCQCTLNLLKTTPKTTKTQLLIRNRLTVVILKDRVHRTSKTKSLILDIEHLIETTSDHLSTSLASLVATVTRQKCRKQLHPIKCLLINRLSNGHSKMLLSLTQPSQ